MSLILCSECGQDLSTEALTCPHCGKPNIKNQTDTPPVTQEQTIPEKIPGLINVSKVFTIIFVLIIVIPALLFLGNYLYLKKTEIKITILETLGIEQKDIIKPKSLDKNDPDQVQLQEVKNLGYTFYIGEIESPGVTNINDDIKNKITKIAYDAHFPISLLKKIPIIILNNLALTGKQYFIISGTKLPVPDLKPDFLSEGGIYISFSNGSEVIFINKSTVTEGQLTNVLTHELGHAVGNKLRDTVWLDYYKLRNIPTNTDRHGTNWNLSPEEDFAEVYKNTFTNLAVQTYFGVLIPRFNSDIGPCFSVYMKAENTYRNQLQRQATTSNASNYNFLQIPPVDTTILEEKTNTDKQVQECRREVLSNPSKYKDAFLMGAPYIRTVDDATKSFILNIMKKEDLLSPKIRYTN